jgi:nitronate monooxygenase
MWLANRLQIKLPIIQAPMAGNTTTIELFESVTRAGGLASLGGGYFSPEKLQDELIKIRSRINYKPFNINLFVPSLSRELSPGGINWSITEQKIIKMNSFLNDNVRIPLNLPTKQHSDFNFNLNEHQMFEQQCQAIWRAFKQGPSCPNVFSFTFGIPSQEIITRFKQEGFLVIGTSTNLEEARLLAKANVDAICIQGSEAGGHRGTFAANVQDALIPTETLIQQVRQEISVPLIAAGGISSGEDVKKFLKLDCPVQIGTAFLTCSECATTSGYKENLLAAKETVVTNVFTGRYARAIPNTLSELLEKYFSEEEIPPFPYQHILTSDIRAWSAKKNCEYFHLWAGTSVKMCKSEQSAFDFVIKLSNYINN